MKKIYIFVCLILLSFTSHAQFEQLYGTWYLDYITVNGVQEEPTTNGNYHIEFTNQTGSNFGMESNGNVCYSFSLDYNFVSSSELEFSSFTNLAEGCNISEEETFFQNFEATIHPDGTQDTTTNTFAIEGLGNDAMLTITNVNGEVAVFGRADITNNDLLGEWFLHSINVDSEYYTYEDMFAIQHSIDISPNDIFGTVCNGYWSDYYLDYDNKISLLSVYQTLGSCEDSEGDFYESFYFYEVLVNDDLYYPSTHTYEILDNGQTLVITDSEGDFATYGRQPLDLEPLQHQWYLYYVNYNGEQLNNTEYPFFDINLTDDPSGSGFNAFGEMNCNAYTATYEVLNNNSLTIFATGITLAECETSVGLSEYHYVETLFGEFIGAENPQTHDYEIVGVGDEAILTISAENGDYIAYGRQPLSINDFATTEISIFPNPTQNQLFIKGSSDHSSLSYSIFDLHGRQVKHANNFIEFIDVSSLDSGVYFIRLQNEQSQQNTVLKFIKN